VVSLQEEDIADLDQITKIFEKLFKNTKDKEYWKVKTGIFSQKLNLPNEDTKKDSLTKNDPHENMSKTKYYNYYIKKQLEYPSMDDSDDWEFLHKTGKYNYTLAGGTRVNGEDVYIIDFAPKKSGKYIGRAYVSINTYALIRADYEYDEGKQGTDIHLLGVGYTVNHFSGSVFFEKKNDVYQLKYFSKKEGTRFSLDRNITLVKKRERFLFDKELFEIKIKFNIAVSSTESFELLYLDCENISQQEFVTTKQPDKLDIIFVNQFDENLWKGYPIIEPTKSMREYKKIESLQAE
jgi:hypothetical protein